MKAKAILLTILLGLLVTLQSQAQQRTRPVQTKSFSVSSGGLFEISTSSGDIAITSWDKNEVVVKAEGIDEEDLPDLDMKQSGNTVRVRFHPEWGGSHRVRFNVNIPVQFNTDLHTSGGDISLTGTYRGTVEGSTSGGDINLPNTNIEGTCDLGTSGGDIIAGKLGGNTTLRTSGGDIKITDAAGEITLSTSGGDIHAGNIAKSLKASTAGGDIVVGDVGGEAIVSTAGGDVTVGRVSGSATLKTAGGDIELRGANGIVKAKTAGGDVVLQNITGSIEAGTAGGDVQAQLRPSGKGRSRLSSSGGDIVLYIPSSAKATIEAFIEIQGRWKDNSEDYEVTSDFKATTYEKDSAAKEIRATYVLNGGGEDISLETVNGNIMIHELR